MNHENSMTELIIGVAKLAHAQSEESLEEKGEIMGLNRALTQVEYYNKIMYGTIEDLPMYNQKPGGWII